MEWLVQRSDSVVGGGRVRMRGRGRRRMRGRVLLVAFHGAGWLVGRGESTVCSAGKAARHQGKRSGGKERCRHSYSLHGVAKASEQEPGGTPQHATHQRGLSAQQRAHTRSPAHSYPHTAARKYSRGQTRTHTYMYVPIIYRQGERKRRSAEMVSARESVHAHSSYSGVRNNEKMRMAKAGRGGGGPGPRRAATVSPPHSAALLLAVACNRLPQTRAAAAPAALGTTHRWHGTWSTPRAPRRHRAQQK